MNIIFNDWIRSQYYTCPTAQLSRRAKLWPDLISIVLLRAACIYKFWIKAHKPYVTCFPSHYGDVIMGAIASQITSVTVVYSTVYSDADQRKHQSSASLAFVRGIHRGSVNSPHKWPVTRKMFPFDDVIMVAASQNKNNGLTRHTQLINARVIICNMDE